MNKNKTKKVLLIFALPLAILVFCLWWFYIGPGAGGEKIKHILLVSIDTCRADHLSCYGFKKQTTPNIDKIAEQGILFENVISPVPVTLPAHTSMLTGMIPPAHGVHDNSNYILPKEKLTLAEILKNEGFRTGAVVSSFVLDTRFGLNQGFDYYQDDFLNPTDSVSGVERRGDETTGFAVKWLQEHKDERFFLFLHYYDPHYKYDPPEPYASRYAEDAYSGEIAFTDTCIGRVAATLKELGIYDSTLLIITGDHGEMLGEHGEDEHMYFIYESALKVPLIVKLPGKGKPVRITSPVGLVDILPTLCALLDIQIPSSLQGISLKPLLPGTDSKDRDRFFYIESMIPTYLGANPLLGITSGSWKYIRTTGAEFYDLKTDPRENVNLILQQQKRARMYDGALRDILREHNPAATASNRVKQKTETLAKLTSLGYVGAEVSADSFSVNMDRADPKELIGLHMTLQRVQELKFAGSYGEAKQILEERLTRESHFKLYEQLGEIAMREQNLGQAAEYYSQALELNRDNYQANLNLGFILVKTGKVQQAADYFKKALSIRPQDIDALRNLGIVFEKTGRPEEACRYFEKVLALEPRDNAALNHLGTIHLHQGKEQEAQRYLTESLKHNPGQPLVLAQLSQVKTMRRDSSCYDPAGAVPLAAAACRLTNFKEPGLLYVLASAYARSGKRTEALKTAQQALRLAETGGNRLLTLQIEGLIRFLKKNNPSAPGK